MHKDFDEFLKLLNHRKVRYVIGGGYALSAYLIPRATKDLDILIEASKNNAIKVIEALCEFGFNLSNLETKELMSPEVIIQFQELINLQDDNGQAKPYQIKQLLKIIEQYKLKMEDSE